MPLHRLPEFFRFCLVGFAGFCTDYGALEALVHLGLPTLIARVFSMAIALHVTYLLNGLFTFHGHGGFTRRSWGQYLITNLTGALINYLTFLLVLTQVDLSIGSLSRLVAILCGTATSLGFNYWANRRFAFRKEPTP